MEKLNKIVESMRVQNNYVEICKREEDLLHKCILCRYYLSSNQWSLLLESHIKNLFNIEKAKDSTSGDGISRNGMNIEIKVSLFTSEIKSIESSFLIESLALNDLEHKRLVNT